MWDKFFRRKEVKFLGRGGMILRYQNNEYFIDSEMSFNTDIDIVIFRDSVRLKDTDEVLTESEKKEILHYLLNYLMKEEKLRIELFPK
jgi:hypothetical protein